MHRTKDLTTLELGYGHRSLARRVVELSGGSWTGLEPSAEPGQKVRIGAGGYGHAGSIPFENEAFDLVFGIQSLEHWEEAHPNIPDRCTYESCLKEVWRVLKPGGEVYFDAPIHLHGHEMFIGADIPRIMGLFDADLWTNVVAEKWRYEHEPLPRYPVPAKESSNWPSRIAGRSQEDVDRIKAGGSVWLLTLTAKKKIAENRGQTGISEIPV
ncbi:MAG TPA: class I SAM-dependent methyltransferase [Gammaproteobacteria bacterium]|nr:class I SAM-dependent methyltransferase [Gammaproteobacteria bacterium]